MDEQVKGQLETDAQEIESQEKGQGQDEGGEQDVDDGTIKFSTHKKLLNQHKNLKSELEELREFKQKQEEAEALKRGEFEKILKAREDKISELTEKLDGITRDVTDREKLQAFLNKVPGKVKRQEYLSFVDLDQIAIDPETNAIDEVSLEREANKFVKNFPDLIQPATNKTLPQVGAIGGERPNVKKSLKSMSREELKEAYIKGQFKK